MKNNRVVFDLNKIQYAYFGYENQWGNKVPIKPTIPTSRGQQFNPEATVHGWGHTTMLEYATRYNLLDVWIPYIVLQVTANHRLIYTGDKAVSIWKTWCEKQFNKKK